MKTERAKLENVPMEEQLRRLGSNELRELRVACWNNADRLLKDAKLLLEQGRHASGFFLSFTALEELAKYLFVCDYITGIVSEKEFRESFVDHKLKIAYAHNNALLTRRNDGSLEATIMYDRSKWDELMEFRNSALYVNVGLNLSCTTPEDQVSGDLADSMYSRASKEFDDIFKMECITERIGSQAFYK